ncbi:MAG: BrnT family toxin [Methylobacter sp.]|uniref:BrnT family toxin n=1 Tax=unclassified Methylobacter TaxID=2635283 RepID=UPI000564DCAC|nr:MULTISPECIES: BrnT family toxin [unclassified Methylobacter]MCL7422132.1 BrnT family toxin [Methylobacter sp.]
MYDFEWDENKNNINRAKHKIDFMDAIQVFFDERRLSKLDSRHDYGEDRYQVIGMSNERVLFVVYTERSGNTIRVISARKANKKERATYERGIF